MATTDARTGFRLPWSSDQRPTSDDTQPAVDDAPEGSASDAETDAPAGAQPDAPTRAADTATQATEGDTMIEAVGASSPNETGNLNEASVGSAPPGGSAPAPSGGPTPAPSGKKPSKFMADLTKAMQAAAESAREDALTRLQADAKVHIEEVHSRSATEAADLRRRADDDVAEIREWSKAEIARIREETESRISSRKGRLETEIEEHAALIERQIERVQARVAQFEDEMARFFEKLLAEDDPTRFASMAGSLPEPPPFDGDFAAAAAASLAGTPEATTDTPAAEVGDPADATIEDPDAAMAAIQAAAEAAAGEEQAAETEANSDGDAATGADDGAAAPRAVAGETDPRLSALGLSAGFAEAEAEALADASSGEEIEIPTIADDALAARLAGLVPADGPTAPVPAETTQVVVTGLISVASIASFKRHLGRLTGVQSVGVSSGPDGEFVFTVTHDEAVSLRDAVPSLPGFGARVTGGSDRQVEVSAKDPENEA